MYVFHVRAFECIDLNIFVVNYISLFCLQILKENKDKRDAEFNERFKHSECWSVISILFLMITHIIVIISIFSIDPINVARWHKWSKIQDYIHAYHATIKIHAYSALLLQDHQRLWTRMRQNFWINWKRWDYFFLTFYP